MHHRCVVTLRWWERIVNQLKLLLPMLKAKLAMPTIDLDDSINRGSIRKILTCVRLFLAMKNIYN